MTALQRAEYSLEWWDERLPVLRERLAADPTNSDLVFDVEAGEKMRERAYTKASDAYDRQCDDEYARQGNAWGGDHVFDTMSGGSVVR